jgi:hypothetical protein
MTHSNNNLAGRTTLVTGPVVQRHRKEVSVEGELPALDGAPPGSATRPYLT